MLSALWENRAEEFCLAASAQISDFEESLTIMTQILKVLRKRNRDNHMLRNMCQ